MQSHIWYYYIIGILPTPPIFQNFVQPPTLLPQLLILLSCFFGWMGEIDVFTFYYGSTHVEPW